jgi:hypothetical protein
VARPRCGLLAPLVLWWYGRAKPDGREWTPPRAITLRRGRLDRAAHLRTQRANARRAGARGVWLALAGRNRACSGVDLSVVPRDQTSQGSLDSWSVLAIVAFVAAFAASIWVLLPHTFTFAFAGTSLLGSSDDAGGVEVSEGYRAAVVWMAPSIESNRDTIEQLSNWFSVSCGCLAAEVILWTISLA